MVVADKPATERKTDNSKTRKSHKWTTAIALSSVGVFAFSTVATASLLPGVGDLLGLGKSIVKGQLGGLINRGIDDLGLGGFGGILKGAAGDLLNGRLPSLDGILGQLQDQIVCQIFGSVSGSIPILSAFAPQCGGGSPTAAGGEAGEAGELGGHIDPGHILMAGPAPSTVRGETEESAAAEANPIASDVLTLNPTILRRDAANQYERNIARRSASPMVGSTGMGWMLSSGANTAAILQQSAGAAQAIGLLAKDASGKAVTQDVMKDLASMNAMLGSMALSQSTLQAKTQASLINLQAQTATMQLTQANLSEGIDEMNRRDRGARLAESMAAQQSPLYIPGLGEGDDD